MSTSVDVGGGGRIKFVSSRFVAVYNCQITEPFSSHCWAEPRLYISSHWKGPFLCCAWLQMQDSPVEVCRSWSSKVPVTPSFCLACHRHLYHNHWSKFKISSWAFIELKCIRDHIISWNNLFQETVVPWSSLQIQWRTFIKNDSIPHRCKCHIALLVWKRSSLGLSAAL